MLHFAQETKTIKLQPSTKPNLTFGATAHALPDHNGVCPVVDSWADRSHQRVDSGSLAAWEFAANCSNL